ncbi:hypothetical protein [Polaromonas sp.]|uniref:hypothetical protein n=1 Tax=Polaromonas sp. TaxID=1869339 RepID=UPI00286C9824|nr:hypothetical protein [Polaromonas sp.]
MKRSTKRQSLRPYRAIRGRVFPLAAACIAYVTAVCASMAAAAAVVTDTVPLIVVGV